VASASYSGGAKYISLPLIPTDDCHGFVSVPGRCWDSADSSRKNCMVLESSISFFLRHVILEFLRKRSADFQAFFHLPVVHDVHSREKYSASYDLLRYGD